MTFFDAHCVLGRHGHWREPQPASVPELLDVMDRLGIGQALVTHCDSRAHHPAVGNRPAAELTAGEPRLLPAWVLLPPGTAETPQPEGIVGEFRAHDVKAAFLCPGTYGHGLEDWEVDSLLEPLAAAGVPVFLDGESGFPGWGYAYPLDSLDVEAAVRLALRHPALPVVMTAFRFRRTNRRVACAMQRAPNLYMELSGWWFYKNVEFLCDLVGPERLLFGTRLPVHDPGATKATVQYADIPQKAKSLIAGGNLRRLLSWDGEIRPETPAVPEDAPADELYAKAVAGADLFGECFADGHAHVGFSSTYVVPDWSPDKLVRDMDRLGVERTCVFALSSDGGDDRPANDTVIEAQESYPGRLIGFARAGANRPVEEARAEWERCIRAGLRGIKLYTTDPEHLRAACAIGQRERLIMVNHNWGEPEQLLELATDFPDAVLVTGHTRDDLAAVCRRAENVYVGTCPLIAFGAAERYVALYGAKRLLFGSDMSDLPIPWGLGPILYADISEADKRAILGGNLRRLLQTHSRP
ncbi:MAG: amidohydrolase family protein, partial [Candidatus Brocadiia bacterium]